MTKKKIVVVEDEWFIAKNIQGCLEEMGYDVTSVVASGEEAVKKAEEVTPDLVLMDIVLRGEMNGIEAAKQINSRFNIPVVYLTAYTDEETMERAKITEPYGYIVKPIEERELYCAVEVALYKHEMEKAHTRQREKFLSVLIHDLKGPLLPAMGFTKRLIEGKARSEEDRMTLLQGIQESCGNLLHVIESISQSLKKRATLESFNPKHIEFSDILLTIIRNALPEINDKGIEIFINSSSRDSWNSIGKVFLKADSTQLKTLIENLLGNAIKYAKSAIKIELNKTDTEIQFTISDDGPGIHETYHDKIFEEYFQVPGSKIGTGIGLYSVKKVVENHNGSIILHSSLNKGTSFEIILPSL